MNLGEKILNTAIITVCSLILSTVICLMAAYAFTRYSGKGLTLVYAAIVASALIPGIVTARPLYDLMKRFGLVDTFPGLIIMYTSALIPFTMLILGNFLSEIPISLDEAAEIDDVKIQSNGSKIIKATIKIKPHLNIGAKTFFVFGFIVNLSLLYFNQTF